MRLILEHGVALLLGRSGRLDTNSVTPPFLMSLSPTFRLGSARELGTPSCRPSKQCGNPGGRHGSCAARDRQNGILSGSRTFHSALGFSNPPSSRAGHQRFSFAAPVGRTHNRSYS